MGVRGGVQAIQKSCVGQRGKKEDLYALAFEDNDICTKIVLHFALTPSAHNHRPHVGKEVERKSVLRSWTKLQLTILQ